MRANLTARSCLCARLQQERKENFLRIDWATVESKAKRSTSSEPQKVLSLSLLESILRPLLLSLWNKSTYFYIIRLCPGTGRRRIWKTCVVWLLKKARAREAERRSKTDNITYFFSVVVISDLFMTTLFFSHTSRTNHSVLFNSNISQLSINIETDNKQRFFFKYRNAYFFVVLDSCH